VIGATGDGLIVGCAGAGAAAGGGGAAPGMSAGGSGTTLCASAAVPNDNASRTAMPVDRRRAMGAMI
jgi:hypothetical protein